MVDFARGLVGLLLAILVAGAPALEADHTWLIGTWELSHDPEGNPKDWLEFTADGKPRASHRAGGGLPANTA